MDVEIQMKCLVTRITASPNARIAGELAKDAQSCIGKIEKVVKALKKFVVEPNSEIEKKGMETLEHAMKQIDEMDESIHGWAVKFGFAEERVKRGAKRKASL